MARQIEEGVEINQSKADIIMNAKGEWNGSRLPRIRIERGEHVDKEEDDPGDRIWKEDEKNCWSVSRFSASKRTHELESG